MARPNSRIWWWITAAVVTLSVGLIALALYAIALDHTVRQRFAGSRWALPAQVYAAPLELYPGLALDRDGLQEELQRLGYRGLKALDGPGTFVVARDRIEFISRQFKFWDGAQAETRLKVRFEDSHVAELLGAGAADKPALFRLDPLLIGSIYTGGGEDRVLVRLQDVPSLLPNGLVLVEDRHFTEHHGIDFKAIGRAAIADLVAGRVVQGGSTITQQLVKNFFLTGDRTWRRKINEALMSLLLETHYGKQDILEAYLNEVYLGQDGPRAVHGFGLGARYYFNKPLDELRPHEIALLVALVKGPSYYNPRKNPERAKERRDLVLHMFAEAGLITNAEMQAAVVRPLGVAGAAQGAESYPAFVDLVKRQLRGQYQDSDLTNEGLRIFTTLNPRTQAVLEKRIRDGLPKLEQQRKFPADTLQGAGVVSSVEGGEVLALVGGRDARFAGFNRAIDARRPIGSLAKPFVYLAALSEPARYNLHSMIEDTPLEIPLPNGDTWAPHNYDEQQHGTVPLYQALAESYNLPAVKVGMDIGLDRIASAMKAAGYPGEPYQVPSMILGSMPLAPLDVAQMYGTLAAAGFYTPLQAIREVTTREGQPLSRYGVSVHQALPESEVYLLNWALEQVMIFGTARSVYYYVPASVRLAGKTGTTDDLRDSWFAGFSADRVAVIWVGRDDNQPAQFTGAAGALQIWAPLMRDLKVRGLDPSAPSDVEEILTDPQTGQRADDNCSSAVSIPYIAGHGPTETAPCARQSPLKWFKNFFHH